MSTPDSQLFKQGPSNLAITIAMDVHELFRVGVLADKGSNAGVAAGAGFGIHAALGGHWTTALGGLAVGLLLKSATNRHKQVRLDQLRVKCHDVLSGLSEVQLREVVVEIGTHYPGILHALQTQALGTPSSQRLLGCCRARLPLN
jgi:hypothetical protein